MQRILATTTGCNPLASSLSMKRRNPLWTTSLIFLPQPIRQICMASSDAIHFLYGQALAANLGVATGFQSGL
jgi:hypothetical protein